MPTESSGRGKMAVPSWCNRRWHGSAGCADHRAPRDIWFATRNVRPLQQGAREPPHAGVCAPRRATAGGAE